MVNSLRPRKFSALYVPVGRFFALLLLLLVGALGQAQAAGITLVQHTSKDAGSTTTSPLAFANANTAGNWIAVSIRGGLSNSQVFTVVDSNGNTYKQGAQLGFTVSAVTVAIYYAENIKGGANTVTVSMSVSGPLRFAIAEYSGVATSNSADGVVAATSQGTAVNSGNVTTTANGDLLLGAIATADAATYTAGSGYTIRDSVPVPPNVKLVTEDQIQAGAGSASATASLAASGNWGVVLLAAKAVGGVAGTPSSITATAGTAQSATVNAAFATQLQATVKDSFNNPVSGITVTFTAPAGGASGTFAGGVNTTTTNAQGVATAAVFTANSTAGGPYNVTASVTGVSTPANFSLTNLAGPPASVTTSAGTPQSATVNTAFTAQLQVTVKDSANNPLSGVVVTFAAPASGASGTFAGGVSTATTNAQGIATAPVFTANSSAGGPYNVTASVTGVSTPASFSLTNLAGAPATITATAGTPQSATVNTAFATQLQATVKDSLSNPVSGVAVTFTAPASGASGTFAGGVHTATTNAQGVATAPIFTANSAAGGPYNVTASVTGVSTPANFSLTNLAGTPATITSTAGTPQSTSINTAFATQLQATVKDVGNNPVSGVTVTFTVPASGASGAFAGGVNTATTNGQGIATAAIFTANSTAGAYNVTASVSGVGTSANFSLTNLGNPPASVIATAGTPQSTPISTAFATQLQVTVRDSGNNPVSGVAVTFTAPASGASGTFAGGVNTATTNAQGVATAAVFTANSTAGGPYNVTASVTGVSTPASFSLTNLAGPPTSVTASAGTPQSATVNTVFTAQLQATVKDAGNNPLSGVTVTFTAPASGASGTFAGGVNTATTNAQGLATAAVFTANGTAGVYNVTASVTGVSTPANFSLTNLAGAPASVAATTGTPQSATVNTAFATQLQATVTDSLNNPVSGVAVTFTAPASGASGTFAGGVTTATTNAQGIATAAILTANSTAGGPYNVTASVTGVSTPANFSLTNLASVAATIALVQHTSVDAGQTTTGSLAFTSNNKAGNWIAVGIRAGLSSSQVFTVKDSNGNTYKQASQIGFTASAVTIALYYAENIKAGANTITVSNTVSGPLRFAILEYSGVAATNSLDAAASATGTGTAANSGNLTTTTGGDLLLATVATSDSATFTAGSGYTLRDFVPAPANAKLVTEDQIQTAPGTTSASASLASSGVWGVAFGAFKAGNGGGGTAPSITNLSQTTGTVGTAITITGANFGASQGTSTVTFNGTTASVSNWSATSVTTSVPTGATTGPVVVTVGGLASNGVTFTVITAPNITSLSQISGTVGTSITITGSNFGASQGTSTVTFNGTTASVSNWSATSIIAPVPAGATTGPVVVTVGGVASNGVTFTVITAPNITSLSQVSGAVGTSITITGSNFGASQGSSAVTFNGTTASISNWSATSIIAPVPAGATTGPVVVTVGGVASNGVTFTVITAPNISNLNPTSGPLGTSVTVTGTNFGATQGTSTVTFSTIAGTPTNWSATSIVVAVPNGATTGNVVVTVSGAASNGVPFTVTTPGPSISSLSLTQGPVGANFTINGSNFGATQGSSTVTLNGTLATTSSWTANSINLTVPAGATTGNVVVTVSNTASNGSPFTVTPPPNITNISPSIGPIGTSVTITGTNFGPTVGTIQSFVTFNGVQTRASNWTDTSITAPVPAGTTTGNVLVNVGGVPSNGVLYTVATPPSITSLNPTAGPVGTSVTITGTNFGASQGTSTITFNGTTATPTSWSATSIVAPVPTGATTGNVVVTVSGLASNGVNFSVGSTSANISLVQHASLDGNTAGSLAFSTNNAAGNWIAVSIRGGSSNTQVFTVSDSNGNTYNQAFRLGLTGSGVTFALYYAENIKGGANTVNVTQSVSGPMRFAILEYSGVATSNSLDAVPVTAQGNSATPSTGTLTTTSSGDLLLAMVVSTNSGSFTAGSGYVITDFVPAEPSTKLIAEHQLQTVVGPASAAATLGGADLWGAGLAAFRSGSGVAQPISVSLSPTAASVPTGYGSQAFTATVSNDFQNRGATWSLSGTGCSGSTCGVLSSITTSSVTYAAPVNVPSPATVTLTATAIGDTTKTASAAITVTQGVLTVVPSPKRAAVTMSPSQTVQFSATVFNDPSNSGVTWQVDGNNLGNATTGTITSTGLFTPGSQPGLHTVTAVSNANASISGSAMMAVTDLAGVYTHHGDNARTGQNVKEYGLTPATVTPSTFGQLFSCPVDGFLYAQPLWVANLTFGASTRNVVFIATEHDSVYAFDADSPACVQLWKTSFLSSGVTPVNPIVDLGNNGDIVPEIGITSTPVIDPATNTLYVVPKTKETVGTVSGQACSSGSPCFVHRLHALDLITGAEKFGGPVVISATNFTPARHLQRPALGLANGTVYIAFGSHGDQCPYQGWVMGYNASTLAQVFAKPLGQAGPNSGCTRGGIWQSGAGPAFDSAGNVYVQTGNGFYDGVANFGDSSVKLSPTGAVLDWFTPFNQTTFAANDIDMASSGVIILPDSAGSTTHPHLVLSTGKVAILYLLDQTNMGQFNSSANNDVQEVVPVPPPNTTLLDGGNYADPAYWNGNIYTTGQNFPLSQFQISNGAISTPQSATSSNMFPPRGGVPVVSANGTTGGVVWIVDYSGWAGNTPSLLDAYDAANVGTQLFSSPASGSGAAGPAVKFTVPTVANGRVYVGGQFNFTVFGLLP